jgi:hypothetical protein
VNRLQSAFVRLVTDLRTLGLSWALVARTGHLVALKVLAGRENDVQDTRWLWEAADEDEKQLARDSLVLITQRRYNRGKDLFAELGRMLEGEA